jgi:hypothetical protein
MEKRLKLRPARHLSSPSPATIAVRNLMDQRSRAGEPIAHNRMVVCDCHCVPMYKGQLFLEQSSGSLTCWISDCGRYYASSLGYFYLRPAAPRVDNQTRSATHCLNERCTSISFMAIVDCVIGNYKHEACWYCFECDTELSLNSAKLQPLWLQ